MDNKGDKKDMDAMALVVKRINKKARNMMEFRRRRGEGGYE